MKKILAFLFALAIVLPAHAANPVVEIKTSMGILAIELYPEQAPKSVENFLQYVKDGYYNGLIFHRVIDGFMIQGGGFDQGMKEKPTRAPIPNEAKNGLKNEPGTLAMARTRDPHSASSQFFINVGNNAFLDYPGQDGWGYAVFGKVIRGLEVVQKIGKVPTATLGFHENVPTKPVIIESAKLIDKK